MLVTLSDNTVVHARGRIGLAYSERLVSPPPSCILMRDGKLTLNSPGRID